MFVSAVERLYYMLPSDLKKGFQFRLYDIHHFLNSTHLLHGIYSFVIIHLNNRWILEPKLVHHVYVAFFSFLMLSHHTQRLFYWTWRDNLSDSKPATSVDIIVTVYVCTSKPIRFHLNIPAKASRFGYAGFVFIFESYTFKAIMMRKNQNRETTVLNTKLIVVRFEMINVPTTYIPNSKSKIQPNQWSNSNPNGQMAAIY